MTLKIRNTITEIAKQHCDHAEKAPCDKAAHQSSRFAIGSVLQPDLRAWIQSVAQAITKDI